MSLQKRRMKSKTVLRAVGVTLGALALMILSLILFGEMKPSVAIHGDSFGIETLEANEARSSTVEYSNSTSDSLSGDTGFHDAGSIDLVVVCENLSLEPSAECWEALDEYFRSKELGHSWHTLNSPLTMGRVFENPKRDRELVFEALERSECRLEEGRLVRYDLNETCHAESFVSFAKFLSFCNFPQSFDINRIWFEPIPAHPTFSNKSQFQSRMDTIEEFRETDLVKYERLKRELSEEVLLVRWRQRECSQFDELRFDMERDETQHQLIQQIGARLGKERRHVGGRIQTVDVLLALAARLGNEYASIHYISRELSWVEHIRNEHPWKQSIHLILTERNLTVKSRIRLGIEAAISMEDAGIDFDWGWLVEKICGHRNNQTSCQTAFIKLQESKGYTDPQKLQAMFKLESVAIERGVYD